MIKRMQFIMNKERFEAFTDAVIAIIMTILVLDIHLTYRRSFDASDYCHCSFISCIYR
ncbi:TMEM175 family protein [Pediococcus pentosaceus]|uniref:TMEM175 family protein n=1 Tax=Pediococcus pentosaceus TaxID=1255 RepID=UPI00398A778A